MITDLVSQVLGGDDFLAQHLGRTHMVCRAEPGQQDRFAGLLTWKALNTLLDTHRLEPPRLRLSRDGETIPTGVYCERRTYRRMPPWDAPLAHLVAEQLRGGATLVLDAIEEMHPPIRELAMSLERDLRAGVQVNAYTSFTAQEGFGTHWDDHDVIVVQVAGAKRWRIYGPTRVSPMYRDTVFDDTPPAEPIEQLTLRAGDVLHVPRGWWHAAAAELGEPSLHLTCGLTTRTGVDLLGWLVDELRGEATLRADLPGADPAAWTVWGERVASLLAGRLAEPGLIGAYLDARDAASRPAAAFSLPVSVRAAPADVELTVRLVAPRPVVHYDDAGTVSLAAGGRRFTLAAAAGPVVELLTSGRPARTRALAKAAGLPHGQVRDLIASLADAGVLAIEGTP